MPELQHILYVEDEPDIQAVAQLALEQLGGYQVTLCDDASTALAAVKTKRPQLLLLDVILPGMDGPSLFQALRRIPEGADLPAIFMTGQADDETIAEYMALGALGVIPKPFDPMTLAGQVNALWQAGQHHP